MISFYQHNYLYIYDLIQRKILKKIPYHYSFNLNHFEYINQDSILLFLSGVDKYFYDTALVVINADGKIKSSFGIHHQGILSSSFYDLLKLDEKTYFDALFPIFISNNSLYKNRAYFYFELNHRKVFRKHKYSCYGIL